MSVVCVLGDGRGRNPVGSAARRGSIIASGCGSAVLLRDGAVVLDGDRPRRGYRDRDGYMTFRHAERYARRRPGPHVWEVRIDTPFWSATWRRASSGRWLVAESGRGFA